MKEKNKIRLISLIAIAFLITTIVVGITACMPFAQNRNNTSTTGIETFEVKKGDVIQSVSATGTVDASGKKNYSLRVSGEVLQVLDMGSSFRKGDILIEVDDTETKFQVTQAELSLKSAEKSVDTAKLNYQKSLDENHITIQTVESNNDLANKQVSAAKNQLTAAQDALYYAEKQLIEAQNKYNEMISYLDSQSWDTAAEKHAAELDEINTRSSYASSENAYIAAQNAVTSAENSYKQAKENRDIAYLNNLSSEQSADMQIKLMANNIDQAETQVLLSKVSLDIAKLDLDKNVITAPFDGIVLATGFSQGEYAGSGTTAVSIVSNDFVVRTNINETDITKISVGNKVQLTFDAYQGQNFEAEIIDISQIPTVEDNIVSFEVTVKPKIEEGYKLLYGISSNLTIVTAEAENVLFIPVQAIYKENGKQYVDILTTDTKEINQKDIRKSIKKVEVTTGVSNYTYVEITSGLKEGDVVITSNIEKME
jgi:HlyD family secretion protein